MELTSEMLLDSRWYEIIISKSGSSQLLDEDRILFIKKICNNNVYLAALCKANSFGHTYMCLDEIITDKAVDIIDHSTNATLSAEAFHALAVINQYDIIYKLFNVNGLNRSFYKSIIKIIIRSAAENQIVELLNVLLKYDEELFITALEQLNSLNYVFSQDAHNRLLEITQPIFASSLDILKIKIVASLKLKKDDIDVLNLIVIAINHNLIRQAIDIVYIYNFHQDFYPLDYIDKVLDSERYQDISYFFDYLNFRNITLDANWLYRLMSCLNVQLKDFAIYLMGKNVSHEEQYLYINRFININIGLNVYSSLNYASILMKRYSVSNRERLMEIIDSLISLSSTSSLILAHKLMEEYEISDVSKLLKIGNLLFLKDDNSAIKEAFYIYHKLYKSFDDKILEAAVALKKRNPKYFKLAYDLVIMYLEPVYKTEDVIIGKTYYALNLFYKKTEAGKEIAIKLAGIPNLIFVPIKNGQVPTRNSIIIVSVIDVVDGKIKVRIVDRCIENKIRMNKIENKPISGFGEQLFQALVKNDKL